MSGITIWMRGAEEQVLLLTSGTVSVELNSGWLTVTDYVDDEVLENGELVSRTQKRRRALPADLVQCVETVSPHPEPF